MERNGLSLCRKESERLPNWSDCSRVFFKLHHDGDLPSGVLSEAVPANRCQLALFAPGHVRTPDFGHRIAPGAAHLPVVLSLAFPSQEESPDGDHQLPPSA